MSFASRRNIRIALGIFAMCPFGVDSSRGQAEQTQQSKQPMAEEVFKNIQVLRGMPVGEFMETMGVFSAALTANCITCHGEASAGSWARYADDLPLKQTARKMILMVNSINQANFGARLEVTCFTCHRGDRIPRVTATMADVYTSTFPMIEPDRLLPPDSSQPSADQILDRYIAALGGAQSLAKLTGFTAKGTAQAYAEDPYPVEIFARAPNQLTTITHTDGGDRTVTYDGNKGWVAMPINDRPVPLLPLIGGDLAGARLDATLSFPASIKEALTQWRAATPIEINDKKVQVVQGIADGEQAPVNLYFDNSSGLLVRSVRYSRTRFGLSTTQIDYDDYRPVDGVKIPFRWTVSWLDGQTVFRLTEVQPNVSIDPARFAKPVPPTP